MATIDPEFANSERDLHLICKIKANIMELLIFLLDT